MTGRSALRDPRRVALAALLAGATLLATAALGACVDLGLDDRVWACEDDACAPPPACPGAAGCEDAGTSPRPDACAPACAGRACGPDGCGGTCGTCGAGSTCNAAGICVAGPRCGDGRCDTATAETCTTCPQDCGACPPRCGDGRCDAATGETCASCAGDCGCRAGETCVDGACATSCEEGALLACGEGRGPSGLGDAVVVCDGGRPRETTCWEHCRTVEGQPRTQGCRAQGGAVSCQCAPQERETCGTHCCASADEVGVFERCTFNCTPDNPGTYVPRDCAEVCGADEPVGCGLYGVRSEDATNRWEQCLCACAPVGAHRCAPGIPYCNVAGRCLDMAVCDASGVWVAVDPPTWCASIGREAFPADCDADRQAYPCAAAVCDHRGLTPVSESLTYRSADPRVVRYVGRSAAQVPYDALVVELWPGLAGAPTAPGTYAIREQNYADCALCVLVYAGCGSSGCERTFLANAGRVSVGILPTGVGETVQWEVGAVVLTEVRIDAQTSRSTPVAGGQTWCLDGASFHLETVAPE